MKPTIVQLFEKVQKMPYTVCKFDEKELNEKIPPHGDCRHKSLLLRTFLEKEGFKVRPVKVIFDWKDLPLSENMIKILKKSGTIWSHNIVEVNVRNRWIKVDCSWDPKLKEAGFPITENWDGISDTKQITKGKIEFYNPDVYENEHKIILDKSEAHKFAEKLNQFLLACRKQL